ncbi:MAG: flavodoxin family protein [Ruminococcus sp.]|nr:flavodoxin family protein [Ruminococcus sp.]
MHALIINCSPVRDGATAEIVRLTAAELAGSFDVKTICIDDYSFAFCKGCRSCHSTAECVMNDDIPRIIAEFEHADIIVAVSPSYWADIPGQFKAFIDRCTPWCNTHEPHASISRGKSGYAIALRTGPSMRECERVIGSIEHFYGHLEIECRGHMGLCSVERRDDVPPHSDEIAAFCRGIIAAAR